MRGQKSWLTSLILVLAAILTACRSSPPAPTSPPPSASPTVAPDSLTPTQPPPTPTQALPTASPLPTWPDRWEPTGGPDGGLIEAVAVGPTDPNTLYAAGAGGAVYKSSDGGETWTPGERLAPPSCPFSALVIEAADANIVYAASACAGIFESPDAGATWSRASDGLDGGVTSLIQSPHAPGLLLAAGHDGQVYRSHDGATTDRLSGSTELTEVSPKSWESISDGLPGERIHSLAASGPDTYWATTANGRANERDGTLYRFSAGYWSAVPFGQPPDTDASNVFVDPDDPATLYVGLENVRNEGLDAYLFRSTDGGFNWTPLHLEGEEIENSIYVLGKGRQSGTLYVADGGGLLSSPDGGETWDRMALPRHIPIASHLRRIAIDPTDDNVLYLPLRGAGIARSEDGGRTWQTVNDGLSNTNISLIAPHPADPATLYVASANGGSTFKSTDHGDSWTRLNSVAPDLRAARRVNELLADPNHPDTVYQVTDAGRAFRSDDGGDTWSAAWPHFRFSAIYALITAPSDPNIIYATENGSGLFRSDDGGLSWRLLSPSGMDDTRALAVHPDNPEFILSGDIRRSLEVSATLKRSKDGGDTWDVALEVPGAVGVTSAAFDPRVEPFFAHGKQPPDPTRIYAASVGPRGILWFSNDAGDSWKPLHDALNFTDVRVLTVAPHRPGTVYAGVWGGGTWRTDDGGQSWQRLPGDPVISAAAIAVDPSNHNVVYIADGTTPHLYRSTDDGNTWEEIFDAGPDYDRLAALALAPSDPTMLYASAFNNHDSSDGAVFRIDTTAVADNTADKTPELAKVITSDLPGVPLSLAIHQRDSRRIFAVLQGGGVWKTVDDGASWRQVKSGLPEAKFSQIVMDPMFPETLFLAGSHDVSSNPDEVYGIWKSTDDGNTWSKVGGATFGRASGPIKAITFHPEDQRVMYAAGDGGIYLSPDRGETWTGINGRIPFTPMNAVATDGQILYAGSAGGGVFPGAIHPLIHTADWTPHSTLAIPVQHIQITLHPSDPQTLYASAFPGGVFETTDGGADWNARNLGLPSFAVVDPTRQGYYALTVAITNPEVLYLGLYGHGVYRSDDGAATWRAVYGEENKLLGANVATLLVHPDDADIAYAATDKGVWQTVDGGRSWEEFIEGLPPGDDVRTLALGADGQLYAGTRGYGLYTRNALHQARDDAWRQLPALSDREDTGRQYTSLLLHPGDANTLYAGSFSAGIFKTTDGGLTWREQDVGLENDGVLSLVFHPHDAQTLYAGTTDGIARSIDGAATWHPWDAGWPPEQWVLSIAVDPANPDTLYACSRNTVLKSTDGGATWFEVTTGLDQDQMFSKILVDRFDPDIVYLATGEDGVYISRDGGGTWNSWNEGLWNRVAGGVEDGAANVLRFSADGRLLYFGSDGSGVWRRMAAGAPTE
jgi:photosystem II stability/assembly factor-like uncharacterized protein